MVRMIQIAAAAAVSGALALSAFVALSQGDSAPAVKPCLAQRPRAVSTPTGAFALSASTEQVGCIQLTVTGASSAPIAITEVVQAPTPTPTAIATLLPAAGQAAAADGLQWLCDRTERTFQASEALADGSQQTAMASVSTPSCANRLAVDVAPGRLHRGYPATLEIHDRWHLGGLRVRACQPGEAAKRCPSIRLEPGSAAGTLRFRLRSSGHPSIEVSDAYQHVQRRLDVLGSRPLLLATGDSEMQVLDDLLATDLSGAGGARVIGDAKQSTAISSPFFFNWPAHAVEQVQGLHPDIVAMFLGGNEGFRLGSAECCGEAWSHAYAARVAGMMRLYLQDGAASVYWFLIPTPSSEPFVRVVGAVDRGIELAAAQFHSGVHVFDLRPLFSPHGHYIDSLTYHGHTITVHEPDGFHLSTAADYIVAQLFIERLRRDGLLP
jgi:hypothetical protein